MDKRSLEAEFGAHLTLQGFKRKASSWYRQTEGIVQVVDLQKSSYGMQFYVNLCCVPVGMEVEGMPTPKEHKCPIRIRLTAAFPAQKEEIENMFDLESISISDSLRKERLDRFASELVLPFFAHAKDIPSLREAIPQGKFKGGAVNLAAQRHLGISDSFGVS